MTALGLAGKTVLVTGASRGIGRGVAEAFVRSGAVVTILADDPQIEAVAAELGVRSIVADITSHDAVADALSRFDALDVLVNNAGLERMTPVEDRGPENEAVFRRILEINIVGTFLVTAEAVPRMRRGGRIINTASIWGRVGAPLFGAYVASKHAVIGLTKSWAHELADRAITVNAVCPGWVRTEASMRSLAALAARDQRPASEILDGILAAQALPGLMEPPDVAGPYLFLASDLAANVTGQTLGVDRGEVPW